MKNLHVKERVNTMWILAAVSLVIGFIVGYVARGMTKLKAREMVRRTNRLEVGEVSELVVALERAWDVSADAIQSEEERH